MKITVLGSGSWGTALTILLARNGHNVQLLGRNSEELEILQSRRENLRYLPGFVIPENVIFGYFDQLEETPDLTVIAVPSLAVRAVLTSVTGTLPLVVVAAKGLDPAGSQVLTDVASECKPEATIGVLSGPNLAVEIVRGIPTVAVAASTDHAAADLIRDAFTCGSFRVSTSDDVIGVEIAGALKNVLAIGAGMSDGLGFGDNTKGAFLSRGLLEMARLGISMGARMDTFLGPAGVGDLFATASSHLSRNYRLGRALGEGGELNASLQKLGQVAEGVPTSEAAAVLARRQQVEMPVFAAVEGVIRGRVSPKQAVALLMDRTTRIDDFLGA